MSKTTFGSYDWKNDRFYWIVQWDLYTLTVVSYPVVVLFKINFQINVSLDIIHIIYSLLKIETGCPVAISMQINLILIMTKHVEFINFLYIH